MAHLRQTCVVFFWVIPVTLAFDGLVVEDHTGVALASARIQVRTPDGRLVSDRDSDRSGRFATQPLEPGRYRLEISKPNYLPARFDVRAGDETVQIRLVRLGVVTGRVLDPAGPPIPNAFVFPLVRDGELWEPLPTIQTDSRGVYRLHGLRPGRYAIGASLARFHSRGFAGAGVALHPNAREPKEFEVTGGEEWRDVDLILPGSGFPVSGTVVGADRDRGFAIGLAMREQPLISVAVVQTQDGAFLFESVPAGDYFVFASGPVRGSSFREALIENEPLFGRAEVAVAGQGQSDIVVQVQPGREGTVLLRHQQPTADCPTSVAMGFSRKEAWGAISAGSAERGRAALDGPQALGPLAPAPYQVVANDLPEGCYQVGQTFIDPRNEEPAVVTLAAAAQIEGRLTGAGLLGGVVVLTQSASAVIRTTQVDPSGRFAFGGLPPGEYLITARPPHGSRSRWISPDGDAFPIEAVGGTTTEIDLPAPKLPESP